MKPHICILLLILLICTANSRGLDCLNHAQIEISNIEVLENNSKGKTICYHIELYSPTQIKELTIKPNQIEQDSLSCATFSFEEHTRKAKVVYYYFIPKDVKEEIQINLVLNDNISRTNRVVWAKY